ncbi:multidrug effflux MFS transporter [Sphingobacterium yanglingense]|uniref:DHA1 family bicyclomycin/chloramphenicol resistance-like MFS transporter n=1 Tax=Sphingobacterium yanglingense TaxID=1437280 RepID=A0A4R6WG13_9SPHI|nr:multidrug effflux MFS transporter [Sphingobacterium yanglingense]TDQ77087.1 DHA1 family bicyclomycin/chloramphenicol resistance-like MFS transporter [Sphingobacterium yanglingense]
MHKNKKLILLILGLLSAIGPFSIDMYLPAFETISKDFSTSIDKVQLSLTAFFIGIAIGQIIYGPLLDRFGRKKPLIIGLFIYIVTSVLCVFTRDIESLIALRFLQALGSCAGMVASRAMVQDYYEPREAARTFSLLMLVVAISPILAPSAGAFLMEHLDWHYIFITLAALGVLIIIGTIFFLPESYKGNPNFSLLPPAIIRQYWSVFVNRTFISYCLIGSIAAAGLYAYLAGSSFIIQELYGLSKKEYGLIFAFVASALILATQLNRQFLKRWTMSQISRVANCGQALVGIAMLVSVWTHTLNLQILIALVFGYLLCQGFIFPNTSAMALSPFKSAAGSASALLGCLQMGLGALSSGVVSFFHNSTEAPMLLVMCSCACIALLLHLFAVPPRETAHKS